jgi:hypothetical protein
VDTVPVISTAGLYYSPQINPNTGAVGYFLLFSPDGTKVGAIVSYVYAITGLLLDSLELFDFNKNTGAFTNISNIPIDTSAAYFCFSPNSQFLYMEMGYWMHTLYQWDISSGINSIINNSKTIIHNGILKGIAPAMQLGKNGKIYMGTATAQINPSDTLSVINYPNLQGAACGLQLKTVPLKRHIQNNFPNFVSNFLVNDSSSNCTTGLKEIDRSDYFEVYPNPATDYVLIKNDSEYYLANYEARFCDVTGREIYSHKFNSSEAIIPTKQYTNGMYILQISSEHKLIVNKKIIIQH